MDACGIDYRFLVNRMAEAFAYHKIITDRSGKPVDYVFIEVNLAFEQLKNFGTR